MFYQVELNRKLRSDNWGVVARLPIHMYKLTKDDIKKSAEDIVKVSGEYIEFHFDKMVIRLHVPELAK